MSVALKIGQVVFYLVRSEGKLKPIRVVEEVTRKTLNGSETVYMVQFPDQQGIIALDTLKGDVFVSADDAYRTLTERSNAAIKRVVDGAVTRARQYFPEATFIAPDVDDISFLHEMPASSESSGEMFEGPDGQMIRVRNIQLPDAVK
jgi:hypothetical protein